jgi:transglutaminase-like putative cysteine protease
MRLTIFATADYDLPQETFLLLMVEPPLSGPTHRVLRESLRTTPTVFADLGRDGFGNPVRRLVAPAGFFTFDFQATVEVEPNAPASDDAAEHAPHDLPLDVLPFTLPSRYCPSDLLTRMAWGEFGILPPGGLRVRAIAEWVRSHVEYRPGLTESITSVLNSTVTSAFDTATLRVGDDRDYAHLVIALCRALGIPARYVSGYRLGQEGPGFHRYAQVYLGGAWHNVDATAARARHALIPIAVGRDAADAPPLLLWGEGRLRELSAQVFREDNG